MTKRKDLPPHDPATGELVDQARPGDQAAPGQLAYYRQVSAQDLRLDELGREILDETPLAPPVGFTRQPTMVDHIRQQIRSAQLAQEAESQGLETFDEADDFDVDDDYDPSSPYEEIFDPGPPQPRYLNAVEELGPQGQARRKPHTEPGKPTDGVPPSDGPRPPAERTAAPSAAPPRATPPVANATE